MTGSGRGGETVESAGLAAHISHFARCAGTAVLRHVAQEAVHAVEGGAVDQIAARTLLRHQTRVRQLLQMKRQCGVGCLQCLGHNTGR